MIDGDKEINLIKNMVEMSGKISITSMGEVTTNNTSGEKTFSKSQDLKTVGRVVGKTDWGRNKDSNLYRQQVKVQNFVLHQIIDQRNPGTARYLLISWNHHQLLLCYHHHHQTILL